MKTTLVAILAVLSVALAGVLGYQKLIQPEPMPAVVNQPIVNQPVIKQPITKQPVATTSNEIVGWKTYKNEQYGYEIKYPKDWFLSEFCEGEDIASSTQFCAFQKAGFSSQKKEHQRITGGVPNDDDINIHVFKKSEPQGASLREVALGSAATGGDKSPILIDEKTSEGLGFILYKDSTYPQSFRDAFFGNSYGFYVIEYTDDGDNSAMKLNVFSQMVSTFKFIK